MNDPMQAEHERFERWARKSRLCDLPLTRTSSGHYASPEVWASWCAWLAATEVPAPPAPIDMILFCPACGMQHIDRDEAKGMLAFDVACYGEPWRNPPHRSHLCSNCKHVWRPADVATNGVAEIKTRGRHDSPPGVSMVMKPPRERKTEAGGLVLNSDGLPRLYSVSFRSEGGFVVEPVVPTATGAVVGEKAAAAAERIGDALRRAPGEPALSLDEAEAKMDMASAMHVRPDTEVEMARRQAERVHIEHAPWPKHRAEREPAWRAATRWTATFDRTERDALIDRLRGVFGGVLATTLNSSAVSTANLAAVREAISFLESLAP